MTTKVKPTVEKWVQELIQIVSDGMIERLGIEPDGHKTWATTTDEIVKELSEELYEQLPHSVQEAKAERAREIKQVLFMYTHQWVGDDKERLCETCGEVIQKYTPCQATKVNINCLVEDLLASLKQEEQK